MDIPKFKEAMNTLLTSWGGDTPPEAIWAANEFMTLYYDMKGTPENLRKWFIEDDEDSNNETIYESIG